MELGPGEKPGKGGGEKRGKKKKEKKNYRPKNKIKELIEKNSGYYEFKWLVLKHLKQITNTLHNGL